MRYVPVVVEDRIAGYLYSSDGSESLQFMGTTGRLDHGFVSAAMDYWRRKARDYRDQGLDAEQAMEQARREPADEYGGTIPGDAVIETIEDWASLRAIAQPEHDPENPYAGASMVGWGADDSGEPELVSYQVWKSYPRLTDETCRYRPARLGDKVIGYLWASTTDDAAGFVRDSRVQPESNYAEGWWLREFTRLHMHGLSPLEAMRARVGLAEHRSGGRVDDNDGEHDIESLDALQVLAGNVWTD